MFIYTFFVESILYIKLFLNKEPKFKSVFLQVDFTVQKKFGDNK